MMNFRGTIDRRISWLTCLVLLGAGLSLIPLAPEASAKAPRNWEPPKGELLRKSKATPKVWIHRQGVTSTKKGSKWYPKRSVAKRKMGPKTLKGDRLTAAEKARKNITATTSSAEKTRTSTKSDPNVMKRFDDPKVEVLEPETGSGAGTIALIFVVVAALGTGVYLYQKRQEENDNDDDLGLLDLSDATPEEAHGAESPSMEVALKTAEATQFNATEATDLKTPGSAEFITTELPHRFQGA